MDFISLLEELPSQAVGSLYSSPWTCRAVLRGVPPLAKQYIMRLLYLDDYISEGVLESWPAKQARSQHAAALRKLGSLQLLLRAPKSREGLAARPSDRAEERAFRLHPEFQHQVCSAVTTGRVSLAQTVPQQILDAAPDNKQREGHAHKQWEGLLAFLTGSASKPPGPPPVMVKQKMNLAALLERAGLRHHNAGRWELTAAGFQFMLMDTYHQLWLLLRAYIDMARQQSGAELASVISFLLQLGGQDMAQPLALDAMQPAEGEICAHLALLGLLLPFRTTQGDVWVSPTRLALALSGSGSAEVQQEVTQGYIIVETNFRLYAYTQSPLQRSVLDLFVRCEAMLPNLYIGTLTRDSVNAALAKGLQAEQLLTFLRRHAHARALQRSPVVPEVVGDQVRLWQAQTQRLRNHAAKMYKEFQSVAVWRAVADKAKELGVWLWEHEPSLRLIAREEGHEQMKRYIQTFR